MLLQVHTGITTDGSSGYIFFHPLLIQQSQQHQTTKRKQHICAHTCVYLNKLNFASSLWSDVSQSA